MFDYVCLKGFHLPETQGCWHEGRLVKLFTFFFPGRKFDQSFLMVFFFFCFLYKMAEFVVQYIYVIACARRKRPPLVRSHHWSPASILLAGMLHISCFFLSNSVLIPPRFESTSRPYL